MAAPWIGLSRRIRLSPIVPVKARWTLATVFRTEQRAAGQV
jgi:hypothetical protein